MSRELLVTIIQNISRDVYYMLARFPPDSLRQLLLVEAAQPHHDYFIS